MAGANDKAAAEVVAALMLAGSEELDGFARRKLGPDSEADLATLAMTRDLLWKIHHALGSNDSAQWAKLQAAAALLPAVPPKPARSSVPKPPQSQDIPVAYEPTAFHQLPEPPAAPPSPPARVPPPKPPPSRPSSPAIPAAARSSGSRLADEESTSLMQLPDAGDPLDATNELDELASEGSALPFKGKAPTPPSAVGDHPDSDPLNQTYSLNAMVQAGPVLPFAGPPPSSKRELTLEQYASLCAECAVHSGRQGETLARYGLDSGTRRELDHQWQQRFAAEPSLRSQWKQLNEQYQAWLKKKDSGAGG